MTAEKIRRWVAAHPNWTLALITCAVLGPFLGKPFNIDEPLFLWVAQHLQSQPGNPYDFDWNWGMTAQPMWQTTENPPLTCYYIAGVAGLLGWSEPALRAAFLLPAVMVILGTRRLAARFCGQPFFAALLTLFSPVFLVSANSVMCDVTMLAFWVWAIIHWMEGLQTGRPGKLFMAAGLVAIAEMTKYYGAALMPLLAAYAIVERKPIKNWVTPLLVPVTVLCAYHFVTMKLYGQSLLNGAAQYATHYDGKLIGLRPQQIVWGLTFTGGCMAMVVFFAPYLWRKRGLAVLLGIAVAASLVVILDPGLWKGYAYDGGLWAKTQTVIWLIGGTSLLALAAAKVRPPGDARGWLLLLWIGGTFIFAAFCNWTVNGRSILPMAPAAAILIVQYLEERQKNVTIGMWTSFAATALLALTVAYADYAVAAAMRANVNEVLRKYPPTGGVLWYEGHWGFQYYMDRAGARIVDFEHMSFKVGDHIAVPINATENPPASSDFADAVELIKTPVSGWVTVWNVQMGVGFYSATTGPVPFLLQSLEPEMVMVYSVKKPYVHEVSPGDATESSSVKIKKSLPPRGD